MKQKKRQILINVTVAFDRSDMKLVDRYVDEHHRGKRAAGVRELVVARLKEMYPENAKAAAG